MLQKRTHFRLTSHAFCSFVCAVPCSQFYFYFTPTQDGREPRVLSTKQRPWNWSCANPRCLPRMLHIFSFLAYIAFFCPFPQAEEALQQEPKLGRLRPRFYTCVGGLCVEEIKNILFCILQWSSRNIKTQHIASSRGVDTAARSTEVLSTRTMAVSTPFFFVLCLPCGRQLLDFEFFQCQPRTRKGWTLIKRKLLLIRFSSHFQ